MKTKRRRFLAWLFLPLWLIFLVFVLVNRDPVHLSFWPLDWSLQLPLSLLLLLVFTLALLLGWGLARRRR